MTDYHSSCRYWLDWESFYQPLKLLHDHCITFPFTLSCFPLSPHCWPCICCPSPRISLWLQEHSNTENMKPDSNTDTSLLSFLPSPYVHWYTVSLDVQKGMIPRLCLRHGQWLLLVLQEGKGCFLLPIFASALASLQGSVYQFALGNQMLQSSAVHKKKVHYLCNTAYDHRSGKYPPRSWYKVKFTGAQTFHAVLSLKD